MQRVLIAFITAWVLIGLLASAQFPGGIPFQGYLTDAQGSPVNAPAGLVVAFRIVDRNGREVFYDADTVIVADGILIADIGEEDNPIPSDKLDAESHIEIWINGQQLEGSIPLGSAPFALVSG
jgi:hypothetical protein